MLDINKQLIEQGFQAFLAPAKINLFLHITGRRADGYHLLQSAFRLIDLHDTVFLKVRHDSQINRVTANANVPAEQDLCVKAAKLLQTHSSCSLGADIGLIKNIPMGGGLGGGSSDAATVLIALNHLWNLGLSKTTLMELGLKLGADVPFFIFGENAWVEGIGEKIQAIPLPAAHFVIITPKVHVSTAEIFSTEELTRNTFPTTIAAFSEMLKLKQVGKEKQSLVFEHENKIFHNDLEAVVCQKYPAVKACLDCLNQFSQARMSGSGASVFVAVENSAEANNIVKALPKDIADTEIFCVAALGLEQHPLYNLIPGMI
jgi:4-diphosphocytidyl-2-C-methyl-D-erythritol kinase